MERIWAVDMPRKIGEEVRVAGWVHSRRDHGKLIFIDLRDRTGILQVVFSLKDAELHKLADTLRPEWVIEVKGKIAERPKGRENPKLAT